MSIAVPPDFEALLLEHAGRRSVPPEGLLREALGWYLGIDPGLVEELNGWQEVRDEALALVDGDADEPRWYAEPRSGGRP